MNQSVTKMFIEQPRIQINKKKSNNVGGKLQSLGHFDDSVKTFQSQSTTFVQD